MANEYAVNREDLTSVANAIRQKGETQEALTFPADFVAAIGAIDVGKNGATLVVTCPSGVTVTVAMGDTAYTETADGEGRAEFIGITTGTWTVTITDGSQTKQKTVAVNADYETSISFFEAMIHITYPSGSVCTVTDGVNTLIAPDTSGSWACIVPRAGTWTVTLNSGFSETVEITHDGEEKTIEKWYLYNLGDECTTVTGGWTSGGTFLGQTLLEPIRNEDNIQCIGEGGSKRGVITTNAIPFDGFSKICIEVIVDSYNSEYQASITLSICTKDTRDVIASVGCGPSSTSKKIVEISIDSTIDRACVIFYAPSTHDAKGRVYRVWLEV